MPSDSFKVNGTSAPSLDGPQRLRAHYLAHDRKHAALVTALAILPGVVFVASDFYLFGRTKTFLALAGIRVLYGAVGACTALALSRARTPQRFDHLLFGWLVFVAVLLVSIDATRPPEYRGHILIEVLVIVLIYAAYQLPLKLQMIAAGILTVGSMGANVLLKGTGDFMEFVAFLVALSTANVLGYLISEQVRRGRRLTFDHLEREIGLRISLENAAAEVKRLEGILPICASCKKIRDEEGEWRQVELYIRARSEADFSHGLCPNCVHDAQEAAEALRRFP
jgi:hypothetical protein